MSTKPASPKNLFFLISLFVLLLPVHLFAQGKIVSGKISGSDGSPIAGVSVLVKGSKVGTATDASGNFSLNVDDLNSSLVISSLGYETQTIPLEGRTEVTVKLEGAAGKELQQVMVVGYGTQRKIDVTGLYLM